MVEKMADQSLNRPVGGSAGSRHSRSPASDPLRGFERRRARQAGTRHRQLGRPTGDARQCAANDVLACPAHSARQRQDPAAHQSRQRSDHAGGFHRRELQSLLCCDWFAKLLRVPPGPSDIQSRDLSRWLDQLDFRRRGADTWRRGRRRHRRGCAIRHHADAPHGDPGKFRFRLGYHGRWDAELGPRSWSSRRAPFGDKRYRDLAIARLGCPHKSLGDLPWRTIEDRSLIPFATPASGTP